MHIYVLIPLSAMLAASALAAAILASGPRLRANWALASMLICTASWALCEVMAGLSSDPLSATLWFRATPFFGLSFGPLGLATVAEVRPQLRDPLMRQARMLIVGIVALSAASLLTPWFLPGASRLGALSGWTYHYGPLAPLLLIVSGGVPFYAILRFIRSRETDRPARKPGQPASLIFMVIVPMSVAILTDAVLPMLGIDSPRLATLCMVVLGAQFWLHSFRGGEGMISDSGFARAILDDLPDGVVLVEQDGLIRAANETFARFIQSDPAALIGRRIEDFMGKGFDVLAAGLGERDLQVARDVGEPIPMAVSSMPIEDRQGGVIGLVVLVRDLRAVVGLRRQLVVSGRLAAVGELAAGIAHEVNNPIAFIQANLNELRRRRIAIEEHIAEAEVRFESPPGLLLSGEVAIDDAQTQITRVAEIVQEVGAFSHAGSDVRGLYNLNDLLEGVLRLVTLQRGESVSIEREQAQLPDVFCASQGMKQVFLSLIRRATAAAGHSGQVRVCTLVEAGRVVVRIEDDGTPVPGDQKMDFFFDPFDPAMGEWGGLELGISHQLVREEGGEMHVSAGSLGGTCVRVTMPLGESASPDSSGAESAQL
ncbi:MAG: PAS domain-containing protein [Deltaproteobacteria bacterium]|nr:PAS domain-containing protein [Deltaproteobacteria bacterium]MBW2383714.1 PAS domain-containing protein [Deltaproteobacteria bacterium]MBW2697000.1 PAS domain-containing protein [Deltaproteobacteria bacterium]